MLTTDEDFDKAAATPNPTNESPNEPPTNAVQKAVQQGAETARNVSKCQCGNSRNAKENGRLRELATCHDVCVINISGGHGGRNSGPFSKEIDRSDRSGADCGALAETRTNSPDLEHALNDPELVAIVAAWPSLSASVRAGINALIRDSGGQYE